MKKSFQRVASYFLIIVMMMSIVCLPAYAASTPAADQVGVYAEDVRIEANSTAEIKYTVLYGANYTGFSSFAGTLNFDTAKMAFDKPYTATGMVASIDPGYLTGASTVDTALMAGTGTEYTITYFFKNVSATNTPTMDVRKVGLTPKINYIAQTPAGGYDVEDATIIVQYPVTVTIEGSIPSGGAVKANLSTGAAYAVGKTYNSAGTATTIASGDKIWVDSGAGQQNNPILNLTAPDGWVAQYKIGNGTYSNAGDNQNLGEISEATSVSVKFIQQAGTKYTVTYNPNGGTGAPAADTVTVPANETSVNANLKDKGSMAKTGMAFVGWSETQLADLSASAAKPTTVTNISVSGNKIVHAVWGVDDNGDGTWDPEDGTFALSFNLNGGTSAPIPTQQLKYGASPAAVKDPTRTGFVFAGWKNGAQDVDLTKFTMPKEAVALVAQWNNARNVNVEYIEVDAAGAQKAVLKAAADYPAASGTFTAEVLTFPNKSFKEATPSQSYTFTGNETSTPKIVMKYIDSTAADTVDVTVTLSGVSNVPGYDASNKRVFSVVKGSSIIINAPEVNNYNSTPTYKSFTDLQANDAVTFTYTSSGGGIYVGTYYALSFQTNGGTAVTPVSAMSGAVIDLNKYTTSRESYTFEGWYSDEALTTKATSVTLNGNKVVYAKWTATEKPDTLREDHVAYVVGSNGLVRPTANITRAEVATIFFRLLEDETRAASMTTVNNFSDVSTSNWYNTAVSTLAAMGIIDGRGDGTFDGDATITRAEFAAIAARFDSSTYIGVDKFNDISGHWAANLINRASNRGWIMGYDDGSFHPNQAITRAEAITLVNRVLKRQPEAATDLLSGMRTFSDNSDTSAWYYLAVQEAANSHDYSMKADNVHEAWTAFIVTPDWSTYEN